MTVKTPLALELPVVPVPLPLDRIIRLFCQPPTSKTLILTSGISAWSTSSGSDTVLSVNYVGSESIRTDVGAIGNTAVTPGARHASISCSLYLHNSHQLRQQHWASQASKVWRLA